MDTSTPNELSPADIVTFCDSASTLLDPESDSVEILTRLTHLLAGAVQSTCVLSRTNESDVDHLCVASASADSPTPALDFLAAPGAIPSSVASGEHRAVPCPSAESTASIFPLAHSGHTWTILPGEAFAELPATTAAVIASLARLLGSALDSARDLFAARRSSWYWNELWQFDQAIGSQRTPAAIADAALTRIPDLIPHCAHACIIELTASGPVPLASRDIGADLDDAARWIDLMDDDMALLREGETVVSEDRHPSFGLLINMPMVTDEQLVGILCLATPPAQRFESEELQIALEIAAQLSSALQHSRMRSEIDRLRGESEE